MTHVISGKLVNDLPPDVIENPDLLKRCICIYPAFINSKKTIAEGRRIPTEKAVENPTCGEIRDVLSDAGMFAFIEDNVYPREGNRDMQFKGRVRVHIKNKDGTPFDGKLSSRKSVMFYVAEKIPKLKTRTQKSGGGDQNTQQGEGGKKSKKKKK